jgi:hypothetical protein
MDEVIAMESKACEWMTRSFSSPIHSRCRRCPWGHLRGGCALLAPCHRGGQAPIIDPEVTDGRKDYRVLGGGFQ